MATPLSEKLTKFAKKNKFGDNMKDSKFGKISEYISTKAAIINLSISKFLRLYKRYRFNL